MPLFHKTEKRQVLELPISAIAPNPHQPRQQFDPNGLQALARSIAEVGILQPLSVRRTAGGWELIAGERRLRAAELAGLCTVPCLPVSVDESTSSLLALIENIQRADLDPFEEAAALRRLMEDFHLSQEEVGRRVGMSQSAVANKLRLLRLPEDIISCLRSEGLTERHGRALLRLSSDEARRRALSHVIRYDLNVAASERYIDSLCTKNPRRATPIYRTRDVRLFLNTVDRSLSIMRSAGVNACCGRQEDDREITLTIRISKLPPP